MENALAIECLANTYNVESIFVRMAIHIIF